MRLLAAGAALLALSACDNKQLTIQSNPSGAIFYEDSTGATYATPVTVNYTLPERERQADGCFYVRPYSIHWASGAVVQGDPRLCGKGVRWTKAYARPSGPGLEVDLQAAAQQQAQAQIIAAQQQAQATQDLSLMLLGAAAVASTPAPMPVQPTVRCTTNISPFGNQVQTTCR